MPAVLLANGAVADHVTAVLPGLLGTVSDCGPAAEAAKLYAETDDSKRKREEQKLTRSVPEPSMFMRGRPTKRTRRQLERLRHGDE